MLVRLDILSNSSEKLIIFNFYSDLTNENFSIGRANSCDYCLSAPEVKQKLLLQMSKRHFTITRDLSDLSNPTYLQVIFN